MWTPETILLVTVVFLFAGFVKGVVGLGLPTVAIAILALSLGLKEGMALIVAPAIVTNIWQAVVGGRFKQIARRLWSLMLLAFIGTWIGGGILARSDAVLLAAMLGVLLSVYSAISLAKAQLPPPGKHEPWLSPIVGGVTGLINGMTGSFAVPGVLYMQAMGLKRDEFVQAMGVTFVVAALALAVSLAGHGLVPLELGLASIGTIVPSLLGMAAGQWVRRRLSEDRFRTLFFVALFFLGLYLALRPLAG